MEPKSQKKLGALAYIGTEATLFYCCLTLSKFTLFFLGGGGGAGVIEGTKLTENLLSGEEKLISRTGRAQAQIGRGPRGLKQAVTRQNTKT